MPVEKTLVLSRYMICPCASVVWLSFPPLSLPRNLLFPWNPGVMSPRSSLLLSTTIYTHVFTTSVCRSPFFQPCVCSASAIILCPTLSSLPPPFPSYPSPILPPCLSSWKPPHNPRSTPTKPRAIPEKRDSSEIQQEEDEELKEGESVSSTPTTPHEEAGKKEGGEEEEGAARRITLRLLGLGPRLYAVAGLINVPVYALSLYAEPTEARARLLSTLPPSFDFSSPPPPSYYNALLSSSSSSSSAPWPRALYLSFCRSVGTKRVLESFEPYPRLAATVLPSVEASFEEAFGGAGIQAGDSVGFVWLEGEGLLTVVRVCLVSPFLPSGLINPSVYCICMFFQTLSFSIFILLLHGTVSVTRNKNDPLHSPLLSHISIVRAFHSIIFSYLPSLPPTFPTPFPLSPSHVRSTATSLTSWKIKSSFPTSSPSGWARRR